MFQQEEAGWKNPYVTDGLVAMWDGIENAGWGVHDDAATVWKDLSLNGRDATLSGTYSWGEKFWHVESVSGQGLATWPAQNLGSNQTIEFVISPIAASPYGRIISDGQSVASPIARRDVATSLYMYGYGIDRAVGTIGNVFTLHSHCITHPSGGPLTWYVDGNAIASSTTSSDSVGTTHGRFANVSLLTKGIDADYYCIRFYNRVLISEEIAANYAVDAKRFDLTGGA
jgi:hypothetical protein